LDTRGEICCVAGAIFLAWGSITARDRLKRNCTTTMKDLRRSRDGVDVVAAQKSVCTNEVEEPRARPDLGVIR
jgi:hypothetical protein